MVILEMIILYQTLYLNSNHCYFYAYARVGRCNNMPAIRTVYSNLNTFLHTHA